MSIAAERLTEARIEHRGAIEVLLIVARPDSELLSPGLPMGRVVPGIAK
jgi:hypothetical protein